MKTAEQIVDDLLLLAIPNGDCLECHLSGSIDREGRERQYVQVGGRSGIKWRVTRLIWKVLKGPIPDGLWVLHTCDNPKCIKLSHLFLGTPKDNTQDMISKDRHKYILPGRRANSERIYELADQGLDRFEIADKLFISPSTVWNYLSKRGPYHGR